MAAHRAATTNQCVTVQSVSGLKETTSCMETPRVRMWRCYPLHSSCHKFDIPSVSEQHHGPMMRQQRRTQDLHDTVQLIRRDCFRIHVFPRAILTSFLTGLTRRRGASVQTCTSNNNTSTVTTHHVGLRRERDVDIDEHPIKK